MILLGTLIPFLVLGEGWDNSEEKLLIQVLHLEDRLCIVTGFTDGLEKRDFVP